MIGFHGIDGIPTTHQLMLIGMKRLFKKPVPQTLHHFCHSNDILFKYANQFMYTVVLYWNAYLKFVISHVFLNYYVNVIQYVMLCTKLSEY